MFGTLKYLAIATATIGMVALVNAARSTSSDHADNVGGQSLKSEQSALIVTGSIRPSSFTTSPIIGSDPSISTYGLGSTHTTDW